MTAPTVAPPAPLAVAAVLPEDPAALQAVVLVAALAAAVAALAMVTKALPAPSAATAVSLGARTGIPMATAPVTARRHRTRPKRLADLAAASATRSRTSLSILCLRLVPSRNGRITFT